MSHTVPTPPYLQQQGTARQLIVDGRPFLMLAGGVHNSSSSSLAYMEPIWDWLAAMGLYRLKLKRAVTRCSIKTGWHPSRCVYGWCKGALRCALLQETGFLWAPI